MSELAQATPLPHITFYFDLLSPYAYLAFERLPEVLAGTSYSVSYQPVFLPAILKHWGQKGPVEIPPKRLWVQRQVNWLAQRAGVPLCWPMPHPFNPLPLLRLAMACAPAPGSTPSRWVVETLFRHVWQSESDPLDVQRLADLREVLALQIDARQEVDAKALLTDATQKAIARGVFGVPTMEVGDQLYWGLDSLEMISGPELS